MSPINNILFLDIETVSQYPTFSQVPEAWKELWNRKTDFLIKDRLSETPESIYPRAAIFAEFGRIICISCGIITGSKEDKTLSLKSFFGDDEKEILQQFCEMLGKWATDTNKCLCAHNGKDFDFPYLCRRLIINGVPIPGLLNIVGKKPWEIPHLDTMELWKFGDFKSYTSLSLLAQSLGIPSPKDDIDGSKVGEVYWQQHDLPRIVSYCQKDVVTVAQVFLRLNDRALVRPENIIIK
jgi:3'-5' exonuclease